MTERPRMQMCACGEGCEDRASVKWRGYIVVDCVPDQQAGRLIPAITEGMADAVAEERAAVVAWMRERAHSAKFETQELVKADALWDAADMIERGEHRRGEER